MPIGSPVTRVNWPMNFRRVAGWLGWPARNRCTVACMHRFSYILGWPPEPASGLCPSGERSRSSMRGYKRTYWSFPVVLKLLWASKGYKMLHRSCCITLRHPWSHMWIDLWTDPLLPRCRRVSAGLHAADALWHACIDFLTYSDDHPVWFM